MTVPLPDYRSVKPLINPLLSLLCAFNPLYSTQEQRPELTSAESSSQTVSPKFSKKKRCVARESLLEQGEKIINELASHRAILEIHYEDEV